MLILPSPDATAALFLTEMLWSAHRSLAAYAEYTEERPVVRRVDAETGDETTVPLTLVPALVSQSKGAGPAGARRPQRTPAEVRTLSATVCPGRRRVRGRGRRSSSQKAEKVQANGSTRRPRRPSRRWTRRC